MNTHATLRVTAKGQVTLKKDVLRHLGLRPGDRITVDLTEPLGAHIRRADQRTIDAFFGCLPPPSRAVSIDELDAAAADGWAGKVK